VGLGLRKVEKPPARNIENEKIWGFGLAITGAGNNGILSDCMRAGPVHEHTGFNWKRRQHAGSEQRWGSRSRILTKFLQGL